MRWSEAAFWDCSWAGFAQAVAGYRRFALGLGDDEEPLSRAEALGLEAAVERWQRTGRWGAGEDG